MANGIPTPDLDNRPQLPDIFPEGEVTVKGERHQYKTADIDSGTQEQYEYELDKAPINTLLSITGVDRDGKTRTFSNGDDYELSTDKERIVWQQDANNLPEPNSIFRVNYRTRSILGRYLDAHEEELDDVESDISEIVKSKFVDGAEGDELDELGSLFGPVIGQRGGRGDDEYRTYLKSVVQSFISRGTVTGIKLAISAATEVPIDDIQVNENFDEVQYEIVVIPATPVSVNLIEEVAEIADPSGVSQARTRFTAPIEEVVMDDGASTSDGQQISLDEMAVDDSAATARADASDSMFADDSATQRANTLVGSDTGGSDDAVAISPNVVSTGDTGGSDDSVTTSTSSVGWGGNWGTMSWAVEQD